MRGLSSIVALIFTVVLLVSGIVLIFSYTVNQSVLSEKLQKRQETISSINQEYLRIDNITYSSGVLKISFTALKGPIDLNEIDVFVNHVYYGNCTNLSCADQTDNGILIEGESAEVNLSVPESCAYRVKLDYRGSSTESYTEINNCWSCHRTITITSNYDASYYPVRVVLSTANFDFSSTDGNDIRFYDGTQKLNYWIQEWNTSNAIIWVEVNVVTGDKNIDMYYCNPYAMSESNGYAVFDWFNFDDTNLLAIFRFDEGLGTEAYSVVGNYSGTLYGATWTTGYFGNALYFDGNDSYVETNFDANSSSYTFVMRLKPEFNQPDGIGKPISDGAWNRTVGVRQQTYPYIDFYVQFDTGATACSSSLYSSGYWYSVAARIGSGLEEIFVNGNLDNSCSISGIPSRTGPLILGVESVSTKAYDYNGILDDLIIFGRSLTDSEVNALSNGYLDNLSGIWVVRKRIDPEPTTTVGSKETGAWILT